MIDKMKLGMDRQNVTHGHVFEYSMRVFFNTLATTSPSPSNYQFKVLEPA
jgi:hypothetical protein